MLIDYGNICKLNVCVVPIWCLIQCFTLHTTESKYLHQCFDWGIENIVKKFIVYSH